MKDLLTDIFDSVYIINLPERTDRRKEMEAELKKITINSENEKITFFPAIRPAEKGDFPSIGAKGCFLSHLAVLKQARERKVSTVLMIEDDLTISPKLLGLLPSLSKVLNSCDWGLCYLGHIEDVRKEGPFGLIPYSKELRTTHFYAVNGKILDRLIEFLETVLQRPSGHPNGGPMHYDGALSTFREQNPDILTLIAIPNLGMQRSSRTDISPLKWFDKLPIVRLMVSQMRKIKQRVVSRT